MKPAALFLASIALVGSAGCGQLDMTPEGDPSRVLVGEVSWGDPAPLPPDATVTVRVVDNSSVVDTTRVVDTRLADNPRVGMPPEVLGSQTIRNPGVVPVAFRVEYRAEDDVLRRGLNVEVRVAWGGKVRFVNLNAHAVTYGNAADTHRITVNPVSP